LALALVTGALITYWGQTRVDMTVTEAFTVDGEICEFSTVAGGDYKLCLFDATNNLDRALDVDFTIRVQEDTNGFGNWVNLEDDAGVLVAITEDVGYYFDPYHGSCAGPNTNGCGPSHTGQTMEEWMLEFPDWLDWYVTQPYPGEYDTDLINDHGENSVLETPLTAGKLTITESVSALDEVQVALYVDSSEMLEGGKYRVIFEATTAE